MRKTVYAAIAAAILAVFGCGNPQEKLNLATGAENGGNYREAASLYAAIALNASPALKLPEAQKGKVMQPKLWQSEIEKYIKGLTVPTALATTAAVAFRGALDGLDRCSPRFETDNTAHIAQTRRLDSLSAFTELWNAAFNPPPPGAIDWDAVVKSAFNKKFSILQLSAPISYSYEVSIVSRKTSRMVTLTLFAENKMLVPLPEGEYTMLVKSSVDFQQGQRWVSEYTALPVAVGGAPELIPMDLKTKVARK
jgi:hypothetical protein